jgi:glycerophosphoryl diester phosphodiesterase
VRSSPLLILFTIASIAIVACSPAGDNSQPSNEEKGGPNAAPAVSEDPTKTPTVDAGGLTSSADAGADAANIVTGTHRTSLKVCWTDAKCPRALVVAHGGDWGPTAAPYGSMDAVIAAFDHDVDAVKIDVRVTKDDVPVVSHSSPFEAWESIDCYNKKIEDMTAADVTKCHFATSTGQTYQRLDTMLDYLRGKMIVQLTVKKSSDFARAISEVVAHNAQDFAFFEVGTSDLQNLIPTIAKSDQVSYVVNVGANLGEIDLLLGTIKNPRAFMFEMDASPQATAAIATKVHPAGIRSFIYEKSSTATVADFTKLFNDGFDVVSANATANNLKARVAINTNRNVSPP